MSFTQYDINRLQRKAQSLGLAFTGNSDCTWISLHGEVDDDSLAMRQETLIAYSATCSSERIFQLLLRDYAMISNDPAKRQFRVSDLESLEQLIVDFEKHRLDILSNDPVFQNPIPDDLAETEREVKAKIRVGQNDLRTRAMVVWDHCCAVTGCNVSRVLEAAHIKPWHGPQTTGREKLDVNNAIILCSHLHKLLDLGYISFNDDGGILLSSHFSQDQQEKLGINSGMRLRHTPSQKQCDYLAFHRRNIFKT